MMNRQDCKQARFFAYWLDEHGHYPEAMKVMDYIGIHARNKREAEANAEYEAPVLLRYKRSGEASWLKRG